VAHAQTLSLPDGHELSSPERHPFALSPDGRRVVYLARTSVWVKAVGGGEPMLVRGPLQGRNTGNRCPPCRWYAGFGPKSPPLAGRQRHGVAVAAEHYVGRPYVGVNLLG
jgi:hypothetical protein